MPCNKIYLATPYAGLESTSARLLAQKLVAAGCEVCSSWHGGSRLGDPSVIFEMAERDLQEIDACDILVLDIRNGGLGNGGAFVELGYALARGKKILLLGEPLTVFCHLVFRCANEDEMWKELEEYTAGEILYEDRSLRPRLD